MPKTRRLSDATLVRRSQQGDRRAFGALVNRYDRRLRGLAFALLLDGGQMDAAMSMAYLRAWRDVVRLQPRDDVGPWLYRAVYNACVDQLRRAEAPKGAASDDRLLGALAALAPADRVAVVLVEREGFTVASAARILGVGVDVIETRLDLAREHLRPFAPEPEPEPEPAEPEPVAEAAKPEPAEAEAAVPEPEPAGAEPEAGAAAAKAEAPAGANGQDGDRAEVPETAYAPANGEAQVRSGTEEPVAAQHQTTTDAEPAVVASAQDAPSENEPTRTEATAAKTAPPSRRAKRGRAKARGSRARSSRAKDAPAVPESVDKDPATDEGPAKLEPGAAESVDKGPATDEPTDGATKDRPQDVPAKTSPAKANDEPEAEPAKADSPAKQPEEDVAADDGRSTAPVEAPPDPGVEGVRVLEPVGSAPRSGNGSAGAGGNGDAPPLPEGDAHLDRTPDDLSEEIVIAEEDAAAARRAAVRQAR